MERAQSLLGELNRVKALIARTDKWKSVSEDVSMLVELATESPSEQGIYRECDIRLKLFKFFKLQIQFFKKPLTCLTDWKKI